MFRYDTEAMKPFRAACLATLAMLTVLVTGCAGGADTAEAPNPTQPAVTVDLVDFDGVRFDVRRDPG